MRAGTPGDSGVLVYSCAFLPMQIAHGAAGAMGTRRSPRPLLGGRFINGSGAWRGEVANVCLMNVSLPRSQPSSPANGSAEWPPDDRLRRAIQYSEASVMESRSRGVLDTPLSRNMTTRRGAARHPQVRLVIARSEATKQSTLRHSGAMRSRAGPGNLNKTMSGVSA